MSATLEKPQFSYLLIFFILLFSAFSLYMATTWGVGLSPDSVSYIEFAQSIKNQQFEDITPHYPPLYPALIALYSFGFESIYSATRYLQITSHVFIVLTLFILLLRTLKNKALALLGGVVFALSPELLSINSMAWSESSFILFSLIGFSFLIKHLTDKTQFSLLLSALFISAACLTRYVGVTVILAGALTLLLFTHGWKEKIKTSVIFSLLAFLPTLGYLAFNTLTHGTSSNRSIVYHLIEIEKILLGINALSSMYFVDSILGISIAIILFVTLSYFWFRTTIENKNLINQQKAAFYLFLIFTVVYILFLFFSISFIDAHTPLDSRILHPVYISVLLLILILVDILLFRTGSTHLEKMKISLVFGVVFLFIGIKSFYLSGLTVNLVNHGQGYLSKLVRTSDILKNMQDFHATHIYSNGPDLLSIYIDSKPIFIPSQVNPTSQQKNTQYQEEIGKIKDNLKNDGGIIVYIYGFSNRWYLPKPEKLYTDVGLKGTFYSMQDGLVILYPPATYQATTIHDAQNELLPD